MTEADDRARFERALAEGVAALGLTVPESAVTALGAHYALLVRWARRMNLTTVTDPRQAAVRHALDCLLFAELVDPAAELDVVDVGSGAGFPGLVLAVARPALHITLLEPIRKRTSFLRVAIAELGLSGVHVRADKLRPDSSGPPWPTDLIVSRATIPPMALVSLAAPVLRPGGRLILTGGQGMPGKPDVAARAEQAGLAFVARRSYVLSDGAERWLDELLRPGDAPAGDG